MGGHHQLALQAHQPLLRQLLQGHALERLFQGQGGTRMLGKGKRGKFRVAFPFQAEAAKVVIEVLGFGSGRRDAKMRAQGRQGGVLSRHIRRTGRRAVIFIHGQMGDQLGGIELQKRPRVDFRSQRHAQGVVQTGVNQVHDSQR
ncbi:hypothetical protein D3C72_1682980 [compost metagenome]